MKTIHSGIFVLLLLALAPMALCQIQDENRNRTAYRDKCPALQSADAATLLQYLNNNKPTADNAICVTWAIYGVGDAKYEPAISTLAGLLDFQRPSEFTGNWNHLPESIYPAVTALEHIGRPSLPALLAAMEAPAASPTAQTSAVEAWIAIYQRTDKRPHGFAALRRAANNTTDDSVKKRLEALIQYGLKRSCNSDSEAPNCRQAAQDGVDR